MTISYFGINWCTVSYNWITIMWNWIGVSWLVYHETVQNVWFRSPYPCFDCKCQHDLKKTVWCCSASGLARWAECKHTQIASPVIEWHFHNNYNWTCCHLGHFDCDQTNCCWHFRYLVNWSLFTTFCSFDHTFCQEHIFSRVLYY